MWGATWGAAGRGVGVGGVGFRSDVGGGGGGGACGATVPGKRKETFGQDSHCLCCMRLCKCYGFMV